MIFAGKKSADTVASAGNSLISIIHKVNSERKVVLGSGSPRRLELLSLMGVKNIEKVVSGFEENLDRSKFESPSDYCLQTAIQKVKCIANKLEETSNCYLPPTILIGADTIVEINGEVLEKPKDEADAYRMLTTLSDSIHLVHTGVTIFTNSDQSIIGTGQQKCSLPLVPVVSFVQTTKVKFIELLPMDIQAYIETGEPFDKAGGYGIQGIGGQFVEQIEGCYFNVMGLPINTLSRQLVLLHKEGKL